MPALYAYWERFFRITFAEFLRCISEANIPFANICSALARFKVRKHALLLDSSHRARILHTIDNRSLTDTKAFLQEILNEMNDIDRAFGQPVVFFDPSAWIETDSNVRYEVVEKVCRNVGVDPEALKQILSASKIALYPRLKELVDMRNDIAHGTTIAPLGQSKWDELQSFVSTLMNAVQLLLYETLANGQHLAPTASVPP
ncbi:hypothetical protein AKJ09_05146 [Labilithrix luteola]|uniref:RiboL-PSP-HEPN domain-containing protein n=1 Tax=Labilithrix luteola TaxID=1391654 RepID=A0A0K1PY97_9BACT|nr:hypothetical protein AKJ09_05146 [Labilithrix luteola]